MKKLPSQNTKQRSSNLELFRIITMLLIVAHHYVINSDIFQSVLEGNRFSAANIFLVLLGAWGKTGINCFVLITGYFMCKSKITASKYFKLLFEVMFYKITIFVIFFFAGLETISLTSLLNTFFPTTTVASGFTDCFLIFYLLIPFANILISQLTKHSHLTLIAILLFAYTFMATVPWFSVKLNYISWFFVLYLIASFVQLHPCEKFNNNKIWGPVMICSILLSVASVIAIFLYGDKVKIISGDTPYYFLSDSNKPFALLVAFSAFMFFRNMRIPYVKLVNTIGATTYGVLLIHSNSDTMRNWLWNTVLKNNSYYGTSSIYAHAIISVLLVFTVCSFIDFLRIKFIEPPAMKLFNKFMAARASKKQ